MNSRIDFELEISRTKSMAGGPYREPIHHGLIAIVHHSLAGAQLAGPYDFSELAVRGKGGRERSSRSGNALNKDGATVMWWHDGGEGSGFFLGSVRSKESGKQGAGSGEACGGGWLCSQFHFIW
jgi:hypothetical protein